MIKEKVVEVKNLKKLFPVTKGFMSMLLGETEYVHAVDNISLDIFSGETLGLVGESGCGKSTTGMLLMHLLDATDGKIMFKAPDAFYLTRTQIGKIKRSQDFVKLKLNKRQKKSLRVDEGVDILSFKQSQVIEIYNILMKKEDTDFSKSFWNKLRSFFTFKRLLITLNEEQLKSIRSSNYTEITSLSNKELKNLRKEIQIIFQNPYESLSPRFSVFDIIAEPLRLLRIVSSEDEIKNKVYEELQNVGLIPPEDFVDRFPHELSGGQRQRVGIARAFILDPTFVVADEPVSMLDVSIRVGVLKIMKQLTLEKQTAFLFITHDLALARHMCDRIAVMYLGRIVEIGPTEEVIFHPLHPYTKALIKAVPKPDPDSRRTEELPIMGEVPSGIDIPTGCRFHPRCLYKIDKCIENDPKLEQESENHFIACIRYKHIKEK